MTTSSSVAQETSESIRWGRAGLIIWGILMIVMGLFFLVRPAISVLVLIETVALFFLIGGAFEAVSALTNRDRHWGWRLAAGTVAVLAGAYVIANPVEGSLSLFTITFAFAFLAVSALIGGLVNLFNAFTTREGRWGSLILGIIQIIISVWLLLHRVAGMLVLVPAFGIVMMIGGLISLIGAFQRNRV